MHHWAAGLVLTLKNTVYLEGYKKEWQHQRDSNVRTYGAHLHHTDSFNFNCDLRSFGGWKEARGSTNTLNLTEITQNAAIYICSLQMTERITTRSKRVTDDP